MSTTMTRRTQPWPATDAEREQAVAEGYILTRAEPICSHGEEGICYDDALPTEREQVASLYNHAFEYAFATLRPEHRDRAEEFASAMIRDHWQPAEFQPPSSWVGEFEDWAKTEGIW